MDVAKKYQLFHPDFFKEMTGPERFMYYIMTLSERHRIQAEEQRKSREKAEEEREHLGMQKYKTKKEFWDEVRRAT